jgi:hypothetical protein
MRKLAIILTLLTLLGGVAAQAQSDPTATAPPLLPCVDLINANLSVRSAADACTDCALYCREITRDGVYQINPGAIGNQGVILRGVQQAYDLFGLTSAGDPVTVFDHAVSVCLKGRGDLLFLPVFASPRPALLPQSFVSGAFTCVRLGSAGTLALVDKPAP